MTKTRIARAKVRVLIHWYLTGSVLKGTVDSGCKEVETHLEVDSDDQPERVRNVVRLAKKGCFAEQMVVRPVPLSGSIRINGEPFTL
jgi:hypothetical protein